jgi:hypothetical protein
MVRDVLREHGFRVTPRAPGLPQRTIDATVPQEDQGQVAERNVRRGPTNPPALHAMLALGGSGLAFAVIEVLLGGTLIYVAPWVVAALALVFFIWLRYGRTFESEVIVATVRLTSETSVPGFEGAVSPEVALEAGRVLSMLHGGERTAVQVVDCPPPHVRELVSVVQRFEALAREARSGSVAAATSSAR